MVGLAGFVGLALCAASVAPATAQPAGPGAQPVDPYGQPQPSAPPAPPAPPTPPAPPPPEVPYYPPQGAWAPPPPLRPLPPLRLTREEYELLRDGEISDGRVVLGVLGSWMGMGLGQAFEGRWSDTGWIFTIGEPVTFMVGMFAVLGCSLDGCNQRQKLIGGSALFGYVGLRVWSLVDVIVGPREHNRRVRDLRMRLGEPVYARVRPYLVPADAGTGATAGLTFQF